MTQTQNPLASEVIHQARAHVQSSSARMALLLSFVPDDKLNWAPSDTARSALRLAAHCAATSPFFAMLITGTMPSPLPPMEAMFAQLHATETALSTREAVLAALDESTAGLVKAIESLDETQLAATVDSPFGPMPVTFWLTEAGQHLAVHAGQLAYLQTIWGDLDNHMG